MHSIYLSYPIKNTSLISFLFVTLLQSVFASQLKLCHEHSGPCENDGICYRVASSKRESKYFPFSNPISLKLLWKSHKKIHKTMEHAAHTNAHFCPSGFTPYDNQCYNFFQKKATWFEANRHCENLGAKLAHFNGALDTNEAQRRREFLQIFSRQEVQNAGEKVGVWIGARASGMAGNSPVEWNWYPGNVTLSHPTFWATFQPRSDIKDFSYGGRADNACAALLPNTTVTKSDDYYYWYSVPCTSRDNYYICQIEESDPLIDELVDQKSERYFYQCLCKQAFSGYNCQNKPQPDVPVINQLTEMQLCKDEMFDFSCTAWLPGKPKPQIVIDMAVYGMPSNSVPQKCFIQNFPELSCASENALALLRQRCQGRQKCKVGPLAEMFPDNPCLPGTDSYLKFRARCIETQMRCVTGYMIGGRCFQVYTEKMTKQAAQKTCMTQGGDLAGPIDQQQHDQLTSILMDYKTSDVEKYWISLRVDNTGAFLWPGRILLKFTPKKSLLASASSDQNGTQPPPCIAYDTTDESSPVWINEDCFSRHGYICEYPPIEDLDETFTKSLLPFLVQKRHYIPPETTPATQLDTTNSDTTSATQPDTTIPVTTQTMGNNTTANTESSTMPTVPVDTSQLPTSMSVSQSGVPYTCEQMIDKHGILWPLGNVGKVYEQPCPKPLRGKMKWECGPNGYYPATGPSSINCKHQWVTVLEVETAEVIADMKKDATLSESYMDVAKHLNMDLKRHNDSQDLVPGDIKGAVNVVDQLVPVFRRQTSKSSDLQKKLSMASAFAQQVGTTSNLLLSQSKAVTDVWNQMPPVDRQDAASTLVATMDDVVTILSRYMAANGRNERKMQWDDVEVDVTVFYTKPLNDDASNFKSAEYDEEHVEVQHISADGAQPSRAGAESLKQPVSKMGDVTVSMPSIGSLLKHARLAPAPTPRHTLGPQRTGFSIPLDDGLTDRTMHSSNMLNSVRLSYVRFTNLGPLLSGNENIVSKYNAASNENTDGATITTHYDQVNAPVLSARLNEIHGTVQLSAEEPVTFNFTHLVKGGNASNPKCVWWNMERKSWNTSGCTVAFSDGVTTTCSCTHMTSFTVLMDITDVTYAQFGTAHRTMLSAITLIGCAISVGCLAISLLVFTAFRTLWSDRTTIHANLCACLMLAELVFIFGIERIEYAAVCTIAAILMHYLFMTAFMWMLFEGIQLYKMLVTVLEKKRWGASLFRILIAYGLPAVLVVVSSVLWTEDYGTNEHCWLRPMSIPFWLFVGPLGAIIATNIVMLLLALNAVLTSNLASTKLIRIKGWLRGSSMLLCLLGITWVFGFALALAPMTPLVALICAYVFTVANALQGLFIFVLHVLMNERASTAIERQIYKWRANQLIARSRRKHKENGPHVKPSTDSFKPHWSSGSDSAYGSNSTGTTGTGGSRTAQDRLNSLRSDHTPMYDGPLVLTNGHFQFDNQKVDLSPDGDRTSYPLNDTQRSRNWEKLSSNMCDGVEGLHSAYGPDETLPEQCHYVVEHF